MGVLRIGGKCGFPELDWFSFPTGVLFARRVVGIGCLACRALLPFMRGTAVVAEKQLGKELGLGSNAE